MIPKLSPVWGLERQSIAMDHWNQKMSYKALFQTNISLLRRPSFASSHNISSQPGKIVWRAKWSVYEAKQIPYMLALLTPLPTCLSLVFWGTLMTIFMMVILVVQFHDLIMQNIYQVVSRWIKGSSERVKSASHWLPFSELQEIKRTTLMKILMFPWFGEWAINERKWLEFVISMLPRTKVQDWSRSNCTLLWHTPLLPIDCPTNLFFIGNCNVLQYSFRYSFILGLFISLTLFLLLNYIGLS